MSDRSTQRQNGAEALRLMGSLMLESVNRLADGMAKSTTGGLDGTHEDDRRILYAADQLGYFCKHLIPGCLIMIAAYKQKHCKTDEEWRAVADQLDKQLDVIKRQLNGIVDNGLQ